MRRTGATTGTIEVPGWYGPAGHGRQLKLMAYRVDAAGFALVSSGSLSWLLWAATDYLPG
ncbi:MAG: hypothetical protein WCQ64_09985 [Acidobacteriota bacterium]